MVRLVKLIEMGISTKDKKFKARGVSASKPRIERNSINQHLVNLYSEEGLVSRQKKYKTYMALLNSTNEILKQIEGSGGVSFYGIEQITKTIMKETLDDEDNFYYQLVAMKDYADDYLAAHILNTTILCVGFARSLYFCEKEVLEISKLAMMHDLGMLSFKSLYSKKRKLNKSEYSKIKQHPLHTVEMIRSGVSEDACEIILDIHERQSGQGYPKGKPGETISNWAKIIAMCDIYEALSHSRAYRRRYSLFESMEMLIKMKKKLIDEDCLKHFMSFMSRYPIGAMVYLNTNEVAQVVQANESDATKPVVHILINSNGDIEDSKRVLNLKNNNLMFITQHFQKDLEASLMELITFYEED